VSQLPNFPSMTASSAPLPTWDGPEYSRVAPGRYDAMATRCQGPVWVRRFRRWSLMVEFELLCESKRVCAFFNMGSNPERPHAGPQSRYFHAWTIANGARPLAKQRLDPNVFLEGQIFKVEIADCLANSEGEQKDDSLVYSRVTVLLSAERANQRNQHNHPTMQSAQSGDSCNQESVIMQSPNQESTNQGGRGRDGKASPQPGVGNANPQQTRRAGASAPAQAGKGRLDG